jgi:hypothetical protein
VSGARFEQRIRAVDSLLTSKQRADRGGSVAAVRQVAWDAMLDQTE